MNCPRCKIKMSHIHVDHWPEDEDELSESGDIFFCKSCKFAQGRIDLLVKFKDEILEDY